MLPTLLIAAALGAPQAQSQTVLLDFTAPWCGPCQQVSPIVAKLQREGHPVRQVDIGKSPEVAKHFGITSIPAFVLLVNGREVERFVGIDPNIPTEPRLRGLLAKIPAAVPQPVQVAEARPAAERKGWFPLSWSNKREAPAAPTFPDEPEKPIVRAQSDETAPIGPSPVAKDPIESAVRIRIKNDRGVNLGSGTVIACRNQKALVLTCWHLFRGFDETSTIEIDVFPQGPGGPPTTLTGKLLASDQDADVGLIGVLGCGGIPVSPLASTAQAAKAGDHVFSIGCGNGEVPRKDQHRVTQLNRYEGPDTVECTGLPVVGRSGGGLFDAAGRVIGVCIAAQKEGELGVYSALSEVHKLAAGAGFANLVPAAAQFAVAASPAGASSPAAPAWGGPSDNPFAPSASVPPAASPAPASAPAAATAMTDAPAGRFERAGESRGDLLAAVGGGAEVRCVIRTARGEETVVINKASQKFLRYLRGELETLPAETSAVLPAKAKRCVPIWPSQAARSR